MTDELKELSVEELFARAVAGDEGDEGASEAVWALRNRGGAEVFEAARVRCGSSVAKERSRALDGDEVVVHAAAWANPVMRAVAGGSSCP